MTKQPIDHWLLFGASGTVGSYLLSRLLRAGAQVDAVSRQPQAAAAPGLRWIRGSLENAADAFAFANGRAPSVIACAGPLDAFAAWLERAPPPAGTRVLALSSLSAEWKQQSRQPAERALAARLLQAELTLLAVCARAQAPATLFRCGMIYGAGRDRSLSPLLRFAQRWGALVLPRAARGLRQPVHADDLAQALLAAAPRADLAQSVLRLPGPDALDYFQMVQRSLARLPQPPRLIRLPAPGLAALAAALAARPRRLGRAAAVLSRLYQDQCAPATDWRRLKLQPRAFDGDLCGPAADFQN
jgi:nucleoside-diphosphate-sugar epimerase